MSDHEELRELNTPDCNSQSSLEAQDPHGPLGYLATHVFKMVSEFLDGELKMQLDQYSVLEVMNQTTITKFSEVKNVVKDLSKTIEGFVEPYDMNILPLLAEVDALDVKLVQLESVAFKVDAYSKALSQRFQSLLESSQNA